jgi:hypothetical protein
VQGFRRGRVSAALGEDRDEAGVTELNLVIVKLAPEMLIDRRTMPRKLESLVPLTVPFGLGGEVGDPLVLVPFGPELDDLASQVQVVKSRPASSKPKAPVRLGRQQTAPNAEGALRDRLAALEAALQSHGVTLPDAEPAARPTRPRSRDRQDVDEGDAEAAEAEALAVGLGSSEAATLRRLLTKVSRVKPENAPLGSRASLGAAAAARHGQARPRLPLNELGEADDEEEGDEPLGFGRSAGRGERTREEPAGETGQKPQLEEAVQMLAASLAAWSFGRAAPAGLAVRPAAL